MNMQTEYNIHSELEWATLYMLNGDPKQARNMFQTIIDATIGVEALAEATRISPSNIRLMFSPTGNPSMNSLTRVIQALCEYLKVGISTDIVDL